METILPSVNFTLPKKAPGLYVQYFPIDNKVYIGESSNVLREISIYRTPFQISNNPRRKYYFDRSGLQNVKEFYIQSSHEIQIKEKKIRLEEERKMIILAGNYSIKTISKTERIKFKNTPGILDPVMEKRKGPWKVFINKAYKQLLPYPNLDSKPNESCLYVIYHLATGNFYIGQSKSSFIEPRILKHKDIIRKCQFYKQQNIFLSQ